MNKLRKPKPLATASSPSLSAMSAMTGTNPIVYVQRQYPVSRTMQIANASLAVAVKPRAIVEQYWAARALVVETVLSTRVQHHKEVAEVRLGEEEKRTKEITALIRANELRQNRLEKFVAALVACLMILFLVVLYIWMHDSPKTKAASHFTIPILSPFTSVVEHETGIISATSVTIFIVVMGILSYAIFRHWFSRRTVTTKVGW